MVKTDFDSVRSKVNGTRVWWQYRWNHPVIGVINSWLPCMIQFLGFYSDLSLTLPVVSVDCEDISNSTGSTDQWNEFSDKNLCLRWAWLRPEDARSPIIPSPFYTDLNITLLTSSRLDNKVELGRLLNLSEKEPDTIFIAAAYRRWGKNCVDYLTGDWIFFLYDKNIRELFLARDHFGNTGLFYYHNDGFLVFSSDIRQLLALKKIPKRLNELFVVKTLVAWPRAGEETAYEGIFRLPPAHYLEVKDQKIKITQYYFLERTLPLHFKRDEEYFERFLELYTRSVRSCLQGVGPFASTLSGGLDSGSVSVLAARELSAKGLKLQSYTSVPLYAINELELKNRFGNEFQYAQRVVDFSGNIQATYIDAKEISLLSGIKNCLFSHAEPGHAAGNYYWIQAILKQAQKDGINVLLTGQNGNGTISWPGYPESQQLASIIQHPSFSVLKKLVFQIAPYPVIDFYRRLGLEKEPWLNYSALSRSCSDYLAIGDRMKREGHDPHFLRGKSPLDTRFKILQPGKSHSGSNWQANGFQYGVEIRDPTKGKELVEFCISIPDRLYRNEAMDRYLIREAMRGLLPDNVRLNKKRGLQGADNIYRVRAEAAEISETLCDLRKSDLANQFLDLSKMEAVFNHALREINKEAPGDIATILLRGLNAGLFLKNFEEKYT